MKTYQTNDIYGKTFNKSKCVYVQKERKEPEASDISSASLPLNVFKSSPTAKRADTCRFLENLL